MATISSQPVSSQMNLSSSHRLPTQSASDALRSLKSEATIPFLTGVDTLDRALSSDDATDADASTSHGLGRGKVTEIWGPNGSGKTLLAVQTARRCLKNGGQVVWLDAATPLAPNHYDLLSQTIGITANVVAAATVTEEKSSEKSSNDANDDTKSIEPQTSQFHYRYIPSLAHLLALILHPDHQQPTNLFSQNDTGGSSNLLLVIDGLHAVIDRAYPRHNPLLLNKPTTVRPDQQQQQKWHAGRRYALLGSLATGLNKLAAVRRNMAILVSTGSAPRTRASEHHGSSRSAPALAPGIGGAEWEAGVWSRVVLFRDLSGRWAGVQKVRGKNVRPLDPVGDPGIVLVPFCIGETSGAPELEEISSRDDVRRDDGDIIRKMQAGLSSKMTAPAQTMAARKRAYDEVADSDDGEDAALDEFGWHEADDELAVVEVLGDADEVIVVPPAEEEKEEVEAS